MNHKTIMFKVVSGQGGKFSSKAVKIVDKEFRGKLLHSDLKKKVLKIDHLF